jgi:hypothetical protein
MSNNTSERGNRASSAALPRLVDKANVVLPQLPTVASIMATPSFQQFNVSDPQLHSPLILQEVERPTTAASADTYHQAQTLFQDFDGTHYAPSLRESDKRAPPFARPRYPPPGPTMVYYPAPVPMNLNLPQRLSAHIPNLEMKRRTVLSNLEPEARKSAIWLTDDQSIPPNPDAHDRPIGTRPTRLSQAPLQAVPPQLRASVFFERPRLAQDVEIKDKSASNTLDDILDASAFAPVSAFTGHMFDPNAGDVYKRTRQERRQSLFSDVELNKDKRRRSSFLGLRMRSMTSETVLSQVSRPKLRFSRSFSMGTKLDDLASRTASAGVIEQNPSRSATPMLDGRRSEHLKDEDYDEEEEEEDPDFDLPEDEYGLPGGPPTTLLAELQIRKQAQKSRNRTALSAFPNGMHSTLLELDAVAQIQRTKRQTARVALAWETTNEEEKRDAQRDDEDVPLGVLFAGKSRVQDQLKQQGMAEIDRPIGLIEQRELEDNEPLSFRRARLRGIDPYMMPQEAMYEEAVESDHEDPDESLAQRLQRLKNEEAAAAAAGMDKQDGDKSRPLSKAFTEELIEQFGLDGPEAASAEQVPEEEETLGQRRARLQREKDAQRPMVMRQASSGSLADLLQQKGIRKVSDKQMVENLPANSLLKKSEDLRAARKDNIRMSTSRVSSGGLLNMSEPTIDPRQSVYGIPGQGMDYSSTVALAQAQQNNNMTLQQAQMLSYQNAQIASMMGVNLGVPMPVPMQMQFGPQQQMQHPNPYATAGGFPQMGMPGMASPQGQAVHDPFLDDTGRDRIDAWRHTVQMD